MAVLLIIGCEDDFQDPVVDASDRQFFPVDPSLIRVYEVDEIRFEISGFDTSAYFLREYVTDSFDHAGTMTYRIRMDTASDPEGEWKNLRVTTARVSDERVIRREESTDRVKLVFPVKSSKTWNGNGYNTFPEQTYRYSSDVSTESTVEDLPGELVRVIISDVPKNIVNQDEQYEIYGKNVGLIEKNSIILNFCTVECDSANQILSGRSLSQRLIAYEKK